MEDLVLPPGVEVRGKSIRIAFMYEGVRCRERIDGVAKINKNSVRYASNKREAILVEIKENRFDYRNHFPNSPNALRFSGASADDINRTVSEGIEMWLTIKEEVCADETMVGYKSKAAHVKDYFRDRKMRSIKANDITNFRKHLRETVGLGTKTINDVFTPLRQAFLLAKREGVIQNNPTESVPNVKPAKEDDESEADPFTKKELAKLEELRAKGYSRPQLINMHLFTCWTGLRLSEALALAWEDIDLNNYSIKITRAMVGNKYKSPKEKASIREFELLQPAIDILKDQRKYTYMQSLTTIERKAYNNVDTVEEELRFVFKNDRPECKDGILRKKAVDSGYRQLLRTAKIRHRGANQCRHTFASSLITRYVPCSFIYPIMGHSSEEMMKKHYAKIIPEDRPNVAKIISGIAGFEYKHECAEVHKKG